MRAWMIAALIALGSASLSACNTVAGFGEDLSQAGGAIEDAARDAKD